MNYYNQPLSINLTDEAKQWSDSFIDLLKTELTKLTEVMHDNILKRFDKVNSDINQRVIDRYKTVERIAQSRIRDYLEQVINEDVIKVAINESLTNAAQTIRILNEHLFHAVPYGRNPLIDIVRRTVFDKLTAMDLTKTTLVNLLTENFKDFEIQESLSVDFRTKRVWKNVYAAFNQLREPTASINDDNNIVLVTQSERVNFVKDYFQFNKRKIVEQRKFHGINFNKWIEDKRKRSFECIEELFDDIRMTSRERQYVDALIRRYLAQFARIHCQLLATKHFMQFEGIRPDFGKEIHRNQSYKINQIQWNHEHNLFAKQPINATHDQFYIEAYSHHLVTQLIPEYAIVPLRYMYEHPIDDDKYQLWIIMPEMKQTLRQYLRQNMIKLKWDTANDFAIEIATALSKFHHVNLVHRDLKSTCVLLDNDQHCYLSNFSKCNRGQFTSALLGTPPIVPELLHKPPSSLPTNYDALAIDVYSFGLILYELLPKDQYHRLKTEDVSNIVFYMNLNIRWKTGFRQHAELILNCLQDDPKARPSITDVLESLISWKEIYKNYRNDNECIDCQNRPKTITFYPCGDKLYCAVCWQENHLKQTCNHCQKLIRHIVNEDDCETTVRIDTLTMK